MPKITAVKNEAFLVSVTKNLTGREISELFIMDIGRVEWNGMVFFQYGCKQQRQVLSALCIGMVQSQGRQEGPKGI